jgi:hypothetical protein
MMYDSGASFGVQLWCSYWPYPNWEHIRSNALIAEYPIQCISMLRCWQIKLALLVVQAR